MLKYLAFSILLLTTACASGNEFVRKDAGKDGAIYVYRAFHFGGVLFPIDIQLDRQTLAGLQVNGYAVKVVQPGMHTVATAYGVSTFEVKSGQMCFVRLEGAGMRANCLEEIPPDIKTMKDQTAASAK